MRKTFMNLTVKSSKVAIAATLEEPKKNIPIF